MVKLIHNVPCFHTPEFPAKEFEFILLHKILDNKFYREYYLDQRNNGKYKILDNSAFELGEGLGSAELIEWAHKLHVDEIVIPDIYGDKDKTLKAMNDFLIDWDISSYGFSLMAVPQGKTQLELQQCLQKMLDEPRVHCIGLNKLWKREKDNDRQMLSNYEYAIEIVSQSKKQVHLLGVNKLSDWALDIKKARSADSRICSQIILGKPDIWEEKMSKDHLMACKRLIEEVSKWNF